jgi:hypothetical protein
MSLEAEPGQQTKVATRVNSGLHVLYLKCRPSDILWLAAIAFRLSQLYAPPKNLVLVRSDDTVYTMADWSIYLLGLLQVCAGAGVKVIITWRLDLMFLTNVARVPGTIVVRGADDPVCPLTGVTCTSCALTSFLCDACMHFASSNTNRCPAINCVVRLCDKCYEPHVRMCTQRRSCNMSPEQILLEGNLSPGTVRIQMADGSVRKVHPLAHGTYGVVMRLEGTDYVLKMEYGDLTLRTEITIAQQLMPYDRSMEKGEANMYMWPYKHMVNIVAFGAGCLKVGLKELPVRFLMMPLLRCTVYTVTKTALRDVHRDLLANIVTDMPYFGSVVKLNTCLETLRRGIAENRHHDYNVNAVLEKHQPSVAEIQQMADDLLTALSLRLYTVHMAARQGLEMANHAIYNVDLFNLRNAMMDDTGNIVFIDFALSAGRGVIPRPAWVHRTDNSQFINHIGKTLNAFLLFPIRELLCFATAMNGRRSLWTLAHHSHSHDTSFSMPTFEVVDLNSLVSHVHQLEELVAEMQPFAEFTSAAMNEILVQGYSRDINRLNELDAIMRPLLEGVENATRGALVANDEALLGRAKWAAEKWAGAWPRSPWAIAKVKA